MKKKLINKAIVKKMSKLSGLIFDNMEVEYFTKQFNETLSAVNVLNQLDTHNTKETHHVTGLENIYREDKINKENMLSQKDALSNTKKSFKGYFVVKAVFDDK